MRAFFVYLEKSYVAVIVIIVCCTAGKLYGEDSVPKFQYTLIDQVEGKQNLAASIGILPDPGQSLDINLLLTGELENFTHGTDAEMQVPMVFWYTLRLRNAGSRTRHEYFSFCNLADSVWMYEVAEGKVSDVRVAGSALHRAQRSIPVKYNYAPVSIDAGEEKLLYFRILFRQYVTSDHFKEIHIQPAQSLFHRWINEYSIQSLYSGLMVLFCIMSVFLFAMFRERLFLFFGAMMLCFTCYFLYNSGILEGFVAGTLGNRYFRFSHLVIAGIVVSVSLVMRDFLRLKNELRTYDKYYVAFSLFSASVPLILKLAGMNDAQIVPVQNLILLFWIILTIIPVILLAYRKDQSAKIFLISISFLFIGSLLHVAGLLIFPGAVRWMQYSFQLGTVFFSGILFYSLFDRINSIRNERQRFEELDKLKSHFFANISHEFRTPLTLMMGPLSQVIDNTDDPEDKGLLQVAYRNAHRQLDLVNQLLDLSKLDAGKMELRAKAENIIPHIKGIVHAYESLAKQKGITLTLDYQEAVCLLYFDRDKMEKICYNLLSNAFKFTPSGGQIKVAVTQKENQLIIGISDTGIGIEASRLPHIFDRFFQAETNGNHEGSGIGLSLVRELVQLHHGTIQVTSEKGNGTTFRLMFPMGNRHLAPGEIISESQAGEVNFTKNGLIPVYSEDESDAGKTFMSAPQPDEAPSRILLIEDNSDVRAFIRQRLDPMFVIIEAQNGEEGIHLAISELPDLIISDVMMPMKNGYEVCSTLKTDIRTSHIPIILLTAKAATEEKIEGLQTGADDYLLKPFDSAELEARVRNLIQLRRQLRERFATSISLRPEELNVNSLDQQFLADAIRIVESNMENEDFGVEALAREIGMSKPNLNRKLRALVNQSTNQFIQSVRLQRAADLLRQHAGTVAEIGVLTGFRSTAYFIKCFRDHFGETPGNFDKNAETPPFQAN